jgi:pentose-5-phosphate-3-epimerase
VRAPRLSLDDDADLAALAADPIPIIEAIHERKMKAGVAISPDTPSSAITDEVGELADMLLVMTVYPGALRSSISSAHDG